MIDKIIILDTETGGLAPPTAGVVEIAYIEIDDQCNILEEHRSLINPESEISPIASGVHGITAADVADAPTLTEFMGGRFLDTNTVMIGHNIAFDIRFVKPEFGLLDDLCTLKLARIIYPDAPDHKLQTLMYYLGLPVAGKHNALDDVMTCYYMIKHMMSTANLSLQGLYNLAKTPIIIDKMPFGKHKGVALNKLPINYVEWALKLDNLDDNLRYSLERLLKPKR